jgi:hypothetical protein
MWCYVAVRVRFVLHKHFARDRIILLLDTYIHTYTLKVCCDMSSVRRIHEWRGVCPLLGFGNNARLQQQQHQPQNPQEPWSLRIATTKRQFGRIVNIKYFDCMRLLLYDIIHNRCNTSYYTTSIHLILLCVFCRNCNYAMWSVLHWRLFIHGPNKVLLSDVPQFSIRANGNENNDSNNIFQS